MLVTLKLDLMEPERSKYQRTRQFDNETKLDLKEGKAMNIRENNNLIIKSCYYIREHNSFTIKGYPYIREHNSFTIKGYPYIRESNSIIKSYQYREHSNFTVKT
ncbi:hypothetical protein BsWGS_15292 [Bradybaena similaris]